MSDQPRHPAGKDRDAKRAGRPPSAGEAPPEAGRAWVRPSESAKRGAAAAGGASDEPRRERHGEQPHPTPRQQVDGSFRMQLGEAAEEEVRVHQREVARLRLQRLRPWVSALFLASVFSLLFYIVSLVLRAAGASETAGAIIFLALLSGGVIVWGLGIVCSLRLRQWGWLAGVGITPFVAVIMAALIPLPVVLVYPLLPLVGLLFAWSKRDELFAEETG